MDSPAFYTPRKACKAAALVNPVFAALNAKNGGVTEIKNPFILPGSNFVKMKNLIR
jgi:hypothetical protein